MTVRSAQLGKIRNSGPIGTVHTIYTAPTGYRVIVKEFAVNLNGAVSYTCWLETAGGTQYTLDIATVTAAQSRRVTCWTVMNAGESLKVLWSTANTGHSIVASGAELQL